MVPGRSVFISGRVFFILLYRMFNMSAIFQTMLYRIIRHPVFIALCFMLTFVCSFSCDDGDETNGLGSDQVETFAQITEQTDCFEISGYFKSLNPSGFCNYFISSIKMQINSSSNSGEIRIEKNVNGKSQTTTLSACDWASSTEIFIGDIPLNPSNMEYSFLVKIYKNVPYKITVSSLYSLNDNGTETHKTGNGCSGTSGINVEHTFEINKTIESQ